MGQCNHVPDRFVSLVENLTNDYRSILHLVDLMMRGIAGYGRLAVMADCFPLTVALT